MAELLNVSGLPTTDTSSGLDYEVWHEHEHALTLFLLCDDQWLNGANGIIGLNMAVVIRMMEADICSIGNKLDVIREVKIIANRAKELINQAIAGD